MKNMKNQEDGSINLDSKSEGKIKRSPNEVNLKLR